MQTIVPKSKEEWLKLRANNLNSTEISALFNCNPYITHYELWMLKKGIIQDSFKENPRTTWGARLQDSIAHGVAEDRGWKIQKMDEYMYDQQIRIGSSFDFFIPILKETFQPALLEIKNVDSLAFKNGWIQDDDGEIEAPLHIELQVQHQLFVSGFDKAYIAALVGGNEPVVLERNKDESVIKQILKKCSDFWRSIDLNIAPQPNFEKDFDTIKEIYKTTKKGKAIEGNDKIKELAEEYSRLTERSAEIDKKKESIKGQMLLYMNDAEKIIGKDFTVSAGIVNKKEHTVKSSVYRNFKVRFMEVE